MNCKLIASLVAINGAAFAYCIPAGAADIAPRPYAAPQLMYSWNGFYVGANFGGVFSVENESMNGAFLGAPTTFSGNPSGVLGGGQLGYNFQFSPQWLIGIEGELDWTSAQSTSNIGNTVVSGTLTSNHNWYDTLDGRLGYIMGSALLYIKGGGAWMNADYAFSAAGAINGPSSVNATRAGWTAGGGIEGLLWPNWSAKLEYDFLDFGSYSGGFPITGSAINFNTQVHEVKIGINYHLPVALFGPF
jgi:opacity protein-like surface antigen